MRRLKKWRVETSASLIYTELLGMQTIQRSRRGLDQLALVVSALSHEVVDH